MGWLMNWKRCERKQSWPSLKYYPRISWKDWGKPRKTCQNNECPNQDLNLVHPEYRSHALPFQWTCFVKTERKGVLYIYGKLPINQYIWEMGSAGYRRNSHTETKYNVQITCSHSVLVWQSSQMLRQIEGWTTLDTCTIAWWQIHLISTVMAHTSRRITCNAARGRGWISALQGLQISFGIIH